MGAAKEQAAAAAAAAAGQQAHQRLEESRTEELNTTKAVLAAHTSPETQKLPPLKNVKTHVGNETDFHRGEVTVGKGPPSKSRASYKVNSAADPRGEPRADLSM